MRVAHIVPDTDAEGPGRRFAVWVQGCTLRCPGCCNPELFDAVGGVERDVAELVAEVLAVAGIEGISVLGGEPLQQPDLAAFCAGVQAGGLTVMLYSGYTRAEIDAGWPDVLAHVDLLVDGRYDGRQPEPSRRWIGSANQQMHFLTDAYHPDDPRMQADNTVEIRFDGREVTVNGWPASSRLGRRRPSSGSGG